jgi:hypothetical protein
MNHQCPICHKDFARSYYVKVHAKKAHMLDQESDPIDLHLCTICQKQFTRKNHLIRHMETVHQSTSTSTSTSTSNGSYQTFISEISGLKSELVKQNEKLKIRLKEQAIDTSELKKQNEQIISEIKELKKKPVSNQTLNVICVTNHDNYLDMLTDRIGFDLALEYIKDCALSDIAGDCKLIEKIYAAQEGQWSFTMDRKGTQITYYDEPQHTVTETRESFGRKLSNNLQNSYLKGINYLVNRNLETRGDPNKFLDTYDVMSWNHHIYQLLDQTYQHKMIHRLPIPHLT